MSNLKPGDRVYSKLNPSETGEVCCVSVVSNTCRVIMDDKEFDGYMRIYSYFITELEKIES